MIIDFIMVIFSCSLFLFCFFSQLAEQYGAHIAAEVMNKSRSNFQLDSMPSMPYAALSSTKSPVGHHTKYDSLSTHPPNEI